MRDKESLQKLADWARRPGLLSVIARVGFVVASLEIFAVISFFILAIAFFFVPWNFAFKDNMFFSQELFAIVVLIMGLLALPTLLSVRQVAQLIEQRPLASVGLRKSRHGLGEFFWGLGLGIILSSIEFAFLYWWGTVRVINFTDLTLAVMVWTFVAALGWLGVAFWEELFFRGYLLQTLASRMGLVPAILISSLAFGAVHIVTYGMHIVILLNLALVGVVLSVLYLKTKALWAPIGMHFANNFFLTHVLSLPIEQDVQLPFFTINGRPVYLDPPSLLELELVGVKNLGELYGWESLVISVIFYGLLALLIWKLPLFRPHPEMEALWQQYVPIAQPWAQLRAWWARRKGHAATTADPPPKS